MEVRVWWSHEGKGLVEFCVCLEYCMAPYHHFTFEVSVMS